MLTIQNSIFTFQSNEDPFLDALASLKAMFKIQSLMFSRLQDFKIITEYYRVLQINTEYNRVLQSIEGYCRVSQSIREYYRVLQSHSEHYRVQGDPKRLWIVNFF